jgi:hypothetical protein
MISQLLRTALLLNGVFWSGCIAEAQVIEFENNGLHYQSLTRSGVTVMCARLPSELKDWGLIQIAISNGSDAYVTFSPEDFEFDRTDGRATPAGSADAVVGDVLERGNHSDLVKLIKTYEDAIYNIPNMKLDNSYEKRREAALGFGTSARFEAAAAASAIALVQTRVPPGESLDGAVFFRFGSKAFPPGHLVVHNGGETFVFNQ